MKHTTLLGLAVLSLLATAPGCTGCLNLTSSPGSALPSSCQTQAPLGQAQRLDILFVIDNSGSMAANQRAVARELQAFVEQLHQSGGVEQDFQIGVVTTSVYQHTRYGGVDHVEYFADQAGRLQPVPDADDAGAPIRGTGTQRVLTFDDPALVSKFSLLTQQGTSGSGQETPFEAARLALLGEPSTVPMSLGGNLGFLRDGARLLVVVLTDEDDCSEAARPPLVAVTNDPTQPDCVVDSAQLLPVSEYYRLFTTQLGNSDGSPRDVIWTAIAPLGVSTKAAMGYLDTATGQYRNIDCPTSHGAGTRHRAMAELFDPSLSNLDSICRDSFHDTLLHIGALASVSQSFTLQNVPDERMLQVTIDRADGTQELCTLANGGITSFTRASGGGSSKVQFGNQCVRRADDTALTFKLLCAT